ncbi:hypothetical protein ACM55F_07195 [Flavobacterium sp. XS2P12]|jgi:hypothetical protein|uniref:hypothetical protein n=1 Tax=Flavobacterium melibiosi TaxID=3398734 RepID=UPI003A87FD15
MPNKIAIIIKIKIFSSIGKPGGGGGPNSLTAEDLAVGAGGPVPEPLPAKTSIIPKKIMNIK